MFFVGVVFFRLLFLGGGGGMLTKVGALQLGVVLFLKCTIAGFYVYAPGA